MELEIVDGHRHNFPPWRGPAGFLMPRPISCISSAPCTCTAINPIAGSAIISELQSGRYGARTIRRRRAAPRTPAFGSGDAGASSGRTDGEPTYVQFLPPHMADLSAPPEVIVTSMDYAGVTTAILQNDHIYGNLAEDFAATGKAYPGRFIGLAQVDEANAPTRMSNCRSCGTRSSGSAWRASISRRRACRSAATSPLHDDPVYDPLWKEVARLNLPLFWVQFGASPVGTYEDEMLCLERIVQRHPDLRHVLVHGIPTAIYADKRDRVSLPEVITRLVHSGHVYPELLYPISWGGRHDYPYPRAAIQFRQLYDRFGPDRFIWGSDMPNVERFCTYRQSLTYALDYFDFLSDADRRLIFRENALGLVFARSHFAVTAGMGELLTIRDLTVRLVTAQGQFDAVADLDLDLDRGEVLAIVGESGSGKSLTALAIMRLLPDPPAFIAKGLILFGGTDLADRG